MSALAGLFGGPVVHCSKLNWVGHSAPAVSEAIANAIRKLSDWRAIQPVWWDD